MNANTRAMVAAINANNTSINTTQIIESLNLNTKAVEAFSTSMKDLSTSFNSSLDKMVSKVEKTPIKRTICHIQSDPAGVCDEVRGQEHKRRKLLNANQPQVTRLRPQDAMMYLNEVRIQLKDQPELYDDFLDIMRDIKLKQIDVSVVINRVSSLFKGNRRLILGFNIFLPDDHQIEVPHKTREPPADAPGF